MQNKIHIRKGDTVFVNTGEYKGQQGRVLEVIRKSKKAIVEGINLVSKHTKHNAKSPQGGILKKEVQRRDCTGPDQGLRLPDNHAGS